MIVVVNRSSLPSEQESCKYLPAFYHNYFNHVSIVTVDGCGQQEQHSSGAEEATEQAAEDQHSGSGSHDEASGHDGKAGTAGTAGTPGVAGSGELARRASSGSGSRLKDASQLQRVVVSERLAGLQQRQQQLEVGHHGYVALDCVSF